MENTSNSWNHLPRDMYYYRQRYKNALFSKLQRFFADEAERTGINKKDIADRLRRHPAQITRWLSSPSNLTLETLSDILFAMEAEPEPLMIARLTDRRESNYMNPLIARILGSEPASTAAPAVRVKNQAVGSLQMPIYKVDISSGVQP